ncbi:MAG: DNA repair protein RadC [Gammaproteobacteria bacterium]|nr:DNA repair protein RadC [Gammaproteobacteria bacterium]
MSINMWIAGEQPRRRLLEGGVDRLTDAELVAICIRTGHTGRDAVSFARELLGEFGGLQRLLDAPVNKLLGVTGLGPAKVAALKASLGVAERYRYAGIARRTLSDSSTVVSYLRHKLASLEREVFACLFLDTRHRLIAFEKLFLGSVDRANVHPREVLKRSLELNAAAVIFAHNHPSGIAEPSASDIQLTAELKGLLGKLDVRLLDHIVIGRGREVSFVERGLL